MRAREGVARCPYCRADLRAEDATWTCDACQAQQHVECAKEVGGGCVGCRAPAKPEPRAATPPALGLPPLLHALGDGYRVQAGLLLFAALVGGLKGGKPGLALGAAAAVSGAVVSGARGAPNAVPLFVLHVMSNLPLMVLCFVAIDALDVPGGRASFAMFGVGLALAAISAGLGAALRRA